MKYICLLIIGLWTTGLLAQDRPPYPDNSLPTEDYASMGLPSIDKMWNGGQYQTGIKLLKRIQGEDKFSLPRMDSPHSAAVFAHLVNIAHLAVISDKQLPLQSRLEKVDSFANVFNDLIGLYIEPDQRQERFGQEVAAIQHFRIHLTHQVLLILREMSLFLGPRAQEEQFVAMMEGQQSAHEESFDAMLSILENPTKRFDESSRAWVEKKIGEEFDLLTAELSSESVAKLTKQLESLQEE
ncbi:MAG: hypothetical protein AAFV95_15185 [Bacteroidota bacterium]